MSCSARKSGLRRFGPLTTLPPDLQRLTAGCQDMVDALNFIYMLVYTSARPLTTPEKGEEAPTRGVRDG